jgi:hypothetical protein
MLTIKIVTAGLVAAAVIGVVNRPQPAPQADDLVRAAFEQGYAVPTGVVVQAQVEP